MVNKTHTGSRFDSSSFSEMHLWKKIRMLFFLHIDCSFCISKDLTQGNVF